MTLFLVARLLTGLTLLAAARDLVCPFVYSPGDQTPLPSGITRHPDQSWMEGDGPKCDRRELGISGSAPLRAARSGYEVLRIIPGDTGVGRHQTDSITDAESEPERIRRSWVRSVKKEYLSKVILFGEGSLRCALTEFIDHFNSERNHQGYGNVLLFPNQATAQSRPGHRVQCRGRLGGLLRFYAYAS